MPANAAITNLCDHTTVDADTGAMRSVQAADLTLSERALGELWSAENLERLARTYWRFLTRVTLGLVQVRYTEQERLVVLLFRPLTLLAFRAPEYELQDDHGVVRWRIERGLLVARAGRESKGHLQIDVRRIAGDGSREVRLRTRRQPTCTSRWRSPTSTRRSPRGSASASTTPPSRASMCSSPTASCARSPASIWRSRAWGGWWRRDWMKQEQ